MSDIKRAVFTTLEPQKISVKSEKKHSKTVRIHVALPESNEDKCPEFNYKDELAAAKKKIKQNVKEPSQVPNGLDPFGDENDDDVRRIALEMEAKYGTGVTSGGPKKKRKGRKDDYADIGAGYDENDSFIDNTDGYDEMIPPNVTTVRGGFYINSGALEFKTDDEASSGVSSSSSDGESESEEEEEEQGEEEGGGQAIKRKRVLDSSDEENETANTIQTPEEGQPEQNGEKPSITMHQAIKKKLFSTEKIQIKKSKLNNVHKTTMKELLREKRNSFQSGDGSKDGSKENKKPMRLSSVQDAIDSVLANGVVSRDVIPSDKVQLMEGVLPPQVQEIVKLPENLPEDILDIIEKIKRSAENYKDGGKVKFFSGEVNVMLLNLERKCKILGRSSRVRVYEHLASFVKCRKETLVKRAKNLVYVEDIKKLNNTKENLKTQINKLMPALITNHEKECQRVMQRKYSQEAATNEELKNLKAPRRRFPLHDEMKRMLREIVMLKKRSFMHEGKPKENLEELLTNYLKQDILTLWPEGWMSMTVLKKYCTPVALKTPDPKASLDQARQSQIFSKTLSNSLVGASLTGTTSVTITPVNLGQRLTEVGNNTSQDTIIQTVLKSSEKSGEKPAVTPKDNGVIVLGSKTREVKQSSSVDCPIIDLTDTPVVKKSVIEPTVVKKPPDFLSHSLKTMQKFAEVSQPAVSVIAFNKNYSNSGASQVSSLTDRTSFSGALSYKDDYQRRLHNSLPSHSKTNTPPTAKPGYNGCS